MALEKVNDSFYVITKAKAAVSFPDNAPVRDQVNSPKVVNVNQKLGGYSVSRWGSDNLKPNQMLKLTSENHIKAQLLQTERDFLLGSHLGLFKRSIVDGKHKLDSVSLPDLEDWMEEANINEYLLQAAANYVYFWNIPNRVSLTSDGKDIKSIDVIDCDLIRKETVQKGYVQRAFIHPDWCKVSQYSDYMQVKQMYDPSRLGKQLEFINWIKNPVPGQYYYSFPAWWTTEEWTKVSSYIPAFHVAGLTNGYNIKYTISVPYAYVAKIAKSEDPKDIIKAREEIAEQMDNFLAGKENADKTFITMSISDAMGKEIPGWKIEPLDNKMSDDAYIKLDQQANQNQCSGHGLDPALAGIDTGGKLGGSGSEKRISYQLHLALRTPQARQLLLATLNGPVKKLKVAIGQMTRDDFFGIEDIDLTTLDKNPTGTQAVVNQSM
jgi:hypothetical protein